MALFCTDVAILVFFLSARRHFQYRETHEFYNFYKRGKNTIIDSISIKRFIWQNGKVSESIDSIDSHSLEKNVDYSFIK